MRRARRLAWRSNHTRQERVCAFHAMMMVRENGGVIEHPATSKLMRHLPSPGERDRYGGITLMVDQFWFGHKAQKRTMLYYVGGKDIPDIPYSLGYPQVTVPDLKRSEREHTPIDLDQWLIKLVS